MPMKIRNLFAKDLFRPINGVIKVNEQAEEVVWQELDEYVVTKELGQHFNRFFSSYLNAIDSPHDATVRDRIGVWVSGFFGSGKSHFIKILSYLLQNRVIHNTITGEERRAGDFFDRKIQDPLLLGEIKRAVGQSTDVLLFNIDSKADSTDGRDAILKVFMRVLNELQGFSADHPHIAEMELQLSNEGKLDAFRDAFREAFGNNWEEERDAYQFRRDEVISALTSAMGMSQDAAGKWFDEAEKNYSISVEKFAKLVRDYLDRRGAGHRIIFVADEVGQFIGSDTHLMLSLQTITENLGTVCGGRAWVVVTSQEDIDAVLGQVVASKANDFSKIQGRFFTRLSLSSSNTDEVIQARLLEKTEEAEGELTELFKTKGDILKNQLSFSNNGATLKNYRDEADFVNNYPFAPYHYQLVQNIFESIRKAGATGMHLARGERSMLDAFQDAAKSIAERQTSALVPLYAFYRPIESFLDTAVKLTIDRADENEGLETFDVEILRLLFLIRYVEIVRPNVDNLVTLCIDEVDADRLELKRNIEASLQRLERETLINRNGDLFYFLTNEERDVSREIKGVDVSGGEMTRKLAELLFEDVMKDAAKHRYQVNKKDFVFNRLCDGVPAGSRSEQNLTLEVITPLNDDFQMYNPAKCALQSSEDGGRIIVKLPDNRELTAELRMYLQTDRYVRQKTDAAAPPTTRRILRDRADENQQRNQRLITLLAKMLDEAEYYVAGQDLSATSPSKVTVSEAQSYLIKNLFTKLDYLQTLHPDPVQEIKATLMASDIGQQNLQLNVEAVNANALKEVREYISLRVEANLRVALDEMVDRFSGRPYGWPEWEVVLLVARLFAGGELKAKIEGATVEPRDAIESFTKIGRWKLVTLLKRKTTGATELASARSQSQQLFNKLGPETEDGLFAFVREELTTWKNNLEKYRALSETNNYPGQRAIDDSLRTINQLLTQRDSFEFFKSFNERKDDLQDAGEDYQLVHDFHTNQRPVWDKLRRAMGGSFKDNRQLLEFDEEARRSLARMDEILSAPEPYGMLRETDALIAKVDAANQQLLAERRAEAVETVEAKIEQVKAALEEAMVDGEVSNQALYTLQQIKKRIGEEESVQKIFYERNQNAEDALESALELIESRRPKTGGDDGAVQARPVRYLKPATVYSKTYLESDADVEEYLSKLRDQLQSLLRENVRIRLQ
jgi:hypothetical protein